VSIDGRVVGNLIGLCWQHHQQVTENRSRVVWDEHDRIFWWEQDEQITKLTQPPTLEALRSKDGVLATTECPTCGQRIREKIEHRHEQKRPRKTWTVTVPNDEHEFGAEILDQLLESARLILDDHGLSYGQGRGVRYFILSTALGIFVAQADDVLSDGAGITSDV
jgi:hypothetical protein